MRTGGDAATQRRHLGSPSARPVCPRSSRATLPRQERNEGRAPLSRHILNLLLAAGLSDDEREEFEQRYRDRVDDWRPVVAGPMPDPGRLVRPDFGASPGRA